MSVQSVGGLGANLAGKVLASALVLGQGFTEPISQRTVQKRKGLPVKSYIRICSPDKEVIGMRESR